MVRTEPANNVEVATWFANRTADDIDRWQGTADSSELYALVWWLVERNEKER